MRTIWRDDEGEKGATSSSAPVTAAPVAWREDEGETHAAGSDPEGMPPAKVWRDDEGQRPSPGLEPQPSAPVKLWRKDEGETVARRVATPPTRSRPAAAPEQSAAPEPKTSRFHRPSTYVTLLIGLAFLALVADGAFVVDQLSTSLGAVEEQLGDGRDALESGDLERARALFEDASENAQIATDATAHPSARLVEVVPGIGADVRALVALAQAAELGADAALAGVDAASAMGVEGTSFTESLYEDGRVDVDALEDAQPHVARAAHMLAEAMTELSVAQRPTIDRVRDALSAATSSVEDAAVSAGRGNALLSALPGLLGADGERRYLLAFQALGEARGTGGVVGVYGVLRAIDGRLSLGKIAPYQDIQRGLTEPVDAPAWFSRGYAAQNAREQWAQANLTPNFTAAAQVMINMYEVATGNDLDGAIAMDPITLKSFMAATGSIADPLSGEVITAAQISDVLLRDSYTRFPDPQEQNLFLKGLVRNFWDDIQTGDIGPEAPAAVGETVTNGHLKVYSEDPDEQDALVALGADGNFAALGPATQLVFNNNYAVNKVDYFLYRTVDTTVEMRPEGGAIFTTHVTVENRAPSEPASVLIGDGATGLSPGTNRMVLAAALPVGAEVERTERDGEILSPFTYRDSGHTVVWDIVTIPPGSTEEVTFVYSIEGPPLGTVGGLTLTLVPQTTVNTDRFSFELVPPPGSSVTAAVGARVGGGKAHAEGELTKPRIMSFVMRRTGD